MGIKTNLLKEFHQRQIPLKNLPTTWGLRRVEHSYRHNRHPLKNLPTTWGLRLSTYIHIISNHSSEKPPHHSGIIQR